MLAVVVVIADCNVNDEFAICCYRLPAAESWRYCSWIVEVVALQSFFFSFAGTHFVCEQTCTRYMKMQIQKMTFIHLFPC